MQIRKVIQRRIRRRGGGVDFAGDVNAVVSANVGERPSEGRGGVRKRKKRRDVGSDELDKQEGEALPDREVMSLINPNLPLPGDPLTTDPYVRVPDQVHTVPTENPPEE